MSPAAYPSSSISSIPSLARFGTLLAFLLALALTLACGGGSEPAGDAQPAAETTISIAAGTVPSGINEYIASGTVMDTAIEYFMLYLPLLAEQTDFQQGPASFEPRLAERWSLSEDRKQLTFHLRPDAVWSDGEPITGADVRFTWQAQISPEVGWFGAGIKEAITDVEVVDAHTVVFHYDKPYANQLTDAVQGVIVPAHVWSQLPFADWRQQPDWFREHAVGSGPFVLDTWQEGERVTMRRNERALPEDRPAYDRLVLRAVGDESTRSAQLRAGEVNFIIVEPAAAAALEGTPGVDILTWDYRQVGYVVWNLRRARFADVRVRRALTMAIDRQAIIDTLYRGFARPTASFYLRDAWVYNQDLEPLPFDPEAARELLAEAGWRDSDGDGVLDKAGEPFRFTLETNAESRVRQDIAVMVQEQLRRVGLEAEIATFDFPTLISRERAGDFDASVLGIGVDTSWNLDAIFHSKAIGNASAWNLGGYSNPEVDRLIDDIQTRLEALETKPLHDRLQAILHEDQPITLLYQPQRLAAVRGITNVEPTMISPFANVRHWRPTSD